MPEAPTSDQVRALPKVILHDHLDGGLRPETVLELAAARGRALWTEDPASLAREIVARCSGSLEDYLAVSDVLVDLLRGDADALYRVARECARDLASDGVVYAEVRWAPEEVTNAALPPAAALAAVTAGLSAGAAEAARGGTAIRVTQILCALRTDDRSLEIARLALANRGDVVGFDLAGAERGFPPARHRAALDLLAAEDFPVTIHAGEADGIDSIRGALTDGRARRIGHGVRLVEDIGPRDDFGTTAQRIFDGGIALEICPSSNRQTGAASGSMAQHPFDRLQRLRFAVTVSPDNRLLSGTSATGELVRLAEAFGYTLADLARFQLTAADAAFLPASERHELRRSLRATLRSTLAEPVARTAGTVI
ncbi:adenosine deaminase [Microbacterium sp. RD1]|uniref:adenosine deaminase n=1 Tax=Microbacterium sp. RD1 TaxID=3457313 RepID=UPI003FA5E221